MDQKQTKITLQVDEETRKKWKLYALEHDTTLTDTIKAAMSYMIKHDTDQAPAE